MMANRMGPPPPERPELDALLEAAKKLPPMTPEQIDAQRRSWVRGQIGLTHPDWSDEKIRALVDKAADAVAAVPEAPNPVRTAEDVEDLEAWLACPVIEDGVIVAPREEIVRRVLAALASAQEEVGRLRAELEVRERSAAATIDTYIRAQDHYREAMNERNTFKNAARAAEAALESAVAAARRGMREEAAKWHETEALKCIQAAANWDSQVDSADRQDNPWSKRAASHKSYANAIRAIPDNLPASNGEVAPEKDK